ncbi:MAG: hypothetical protein E6J73_04570 [Deltaproteobacteria bacterium]|nr:MAG: hypothetical protein E6J73_04570 [Deltaproteobacteria bacterium]
MDLVAGKSREIGPAAADKNILEFHAVLIEQTIIERRIKMDETTRHGASRNSKTENLLARFGQVGIGE